MTFTSAKLASNNGIAVVQALNSGIPLWFALVEVKDQRDISMSEMSGIFGEIKTQDSKVSWVLNDLYTSLIRRDKAINPLPRIMGDDDYWEEGDDGGGKQYFQNPQGKCEDAPCCGCCGYM